MEIEDHYNISKEITEIEESPECAYNKIKNKQFISPVICVCGQGGAGKSTLLNALLRSNYFQDKLCAILTCDPASPNGGSIQGDIFRMHELLENNNFFIRALPLRNTYFSVPPYIVEIISYLETKYFNYIFVETQGIAQGNYDAYYISDILIYVVDPSTGDDLQLIKRGIHKFADIIFVNKGDIQKPREIDVENTVIVYGSAINKKGIDECLSSLLKVIEERKNGLNAKRKEKRLKWYELVLREAFCQFFKRVNEDDVNEYLLNVPYSYAIRQAKAIVYNSR